MIKSNDFGFHHIFIKSSSTNTSNNKREYDEINSNLTLVLLHGTGGNEEDLIFLGKEIEPNASILSSRGKVLENGMPRFFRRLSEGVFDLEDLKFRTYELADLFKIVRHIMNLIYIIQLQLDFQMELILLLV